VEISLDNQQPLEVYCPRGGGIKLTLTATDKGLKVTTFSSRLKVQDHSKRYIREWLLFREDEDGFDRT